MAAKDLIMIYHVPVKNFTRHQTQEQISEIFNYVEDKRYFKQYVIPQPNCDKFEIECINIKGFKKTIYSKKIDLGAEDIMKIMDYIIKQNRINKINRINSILNDEV